MKIWPCGDMKEERSSACHLKTVRGILTCIFWIWIHFVWFYLPHNCCGIDNSLYQLDIFSLLKSVQMCSWVLQWILICMWSPISNIYCYSSENSTRQRTGEGSRSNVWEKNSWEVTSEWLEDRVWVFWCWRIRKKKAVSHYQKSGDLFKKVSLPAISGSCGYGMTLKRTGSNFWACCGFPVWVRAKLSLCVCTSWLGIGVCSHVRCSGVSGKSRQHWQVWYRTCDSSVVLWGDEWRSVMPEMMSEGIISLCEGNWNELAIFFGTCKMRKGVVASCSISFLSSLLKL